MTQNGSIPVKKIPPQVAPQKKRAPVRLEVPVNARVWIAGIDIAFYVQITHLDSHYCLFSSPTTLPCNVVIYVEMLIPGQLLPFTFTARVSRVFSDTEPPSVACLFEWIPPESAQFLQELFRSSC